MRAPTRSTVLVAATVTLMTASAASAAWSISGSGSGSVKARSMPAGSVPTKSVNAPSIVVSWTASTVGGAAVDSYTVRRYSEAGVLQTITAGCSGAVTSATCTENTVPVGRWQYTTQPVKGAWSGAESGKSATAEIAAAPTGVSCTTCTTFGSTKYVNNAGKLAVTLQVTLAATSLATDTVHLTLTDSASNVVTATTQAATAGAGTVTFAALSTAGLVDGAVTAAAWVTTNTSDSSAVTTTGLVRDTTAPTAADIFGTNGGTAKKIDTVGGDTLVYTFSEPMDPASIQTAWTGASRNISIAIAGGDAITAAAATGLGSVSTGGAGYVATASTVNCTTTTMVMSGSTVTLNLSHCVQATSLNTTSGAETFVWTPSATATDQAGNPMSTTARSELGGPKGNF